MGDRNSGKKHIAVFAFPFASHPGSVLSLVRRLAKAAPHFTFSFFNTAKSNASLFSTTRRPEDKNIRAFDVPDGVPEGYVFRGKPVEDIEMFLEVAEENLKKCLKQAEEEVIGMRVSCVMADAFLWFSGEIAEELRVPWVPVWNSGVNSLSVHVYTELIRRTVGIHGMDGREDEIITCVPGFSQLRLGDLPAGVVHGRLDSPFSNMLYKMGQVIHKSDALTVNSIEEFDPPVMEDLKLKFKNVLNVGPFRLTSSTNFQDTHGCIPWLDNHQTGTVAYIGFGTGATPQPVELKALAEALEATNTPFIWSLKDSMKPHLPEGFLERTSRDETGKIVPWAPQVQILSHESVGVFLSHCGWGSVMESIIAGVPIIGRPFLGDQQLNACMVEKVLKIGVRIDGDCFTKDSTIRVLELVLKQEQGQRVKDQIMFYKKLALEAAKPNGSATINFQTLVQIIDRAHLN